MKIECKMQMSPVKDVSADEDYVSELVDEGIKQTADFQASELYVDIIVPSRDQLRHFLYDDPTFPQLEEACKRENLQWNHIIDMLDEDEEAYKQFSKVRFDMRNKANINLANKLNEGYQLLLIIRERLTGQHISTKFIVQIGKKIYEVDEAEIEHETVLSTYGASKNNPVSAAYSLSAEMVEAKGTLIADLSDPDLFKEGKSAILWKTIWQLKRPYLDDKSQETHREYKNIYIDSKDAEIYRLYEASKELSQLDLPTYKKLRKDMGGNGGYATPFYKMGDIGSIQVKFFKFRSKAKATHVNFARLALIKNRTDELLSIFEQPPEIMKEKLIHFYTENEKNVKNEVSKQFNEAAKQAINEAFKIAGVDK